MGNQQKIEIAREKARPLMNQQAGGLTQTGADYKYVLQDGGKQGLERLRQSLVSRERGKIATMTPAEFLERRKQEFYQEVDAAAKQASFTFDSEQEHEVVAVKNWRALEQDSGRSI